MAESFGYFIDQEVPQYQYASRMTCKGATISLHDLVIEVPGVNPTGEPGVISHDSHHSSLADA
jgi:hypothetical protein